jgi:lipopolysaccharide/colanic/teichoic acid biosynthesis glycosyltransferase
MLAALEPRPDPGLPPAGATDSDPHIRFPEDGVYGFVKRVLDGIAAVLLLVVTAPLVLVAMLIIKLTSRGPALYSQTRLGKNGRPFVIYKLRTMEHECESLTGARWSTPGDARITPVGRWLRSTHVDELPQLWNVLRGDMSLIGPRPERPEFVPTLEKAIPRYRERLLVRPGVTGLAQVQLPPDSDLQSVRGKLAYDLYYVRHAGLWIDLRICLATAFKMLGVPFARLRTLFALPAREIIEKAYNDLLDPPGPRPHSQPKGPVPVLS